MRQIADFHIHSRYSRACSGQLTLANIDKTCRTKGVDIIGTGDFTFPEWFSSIKNELEEIEKTGLYKLRTANDDKIKFILTTELALIYKSGGKARRIHVVIHAPNVEAVSELNKFLDKHYNIRSDGRPILGMSAVDLCKLCFSIDPNFLIYPAHIWTPWFSVFGSKSGFDSLEECFGEYTKNIYAYETGLSSDPEMNWRIPALDRLTLLSNSDAHSPANIAREANVFDLDVASYEEIYSSIKNKDIKKLKYSIEFYPEEGMYHFDGHRDCGVSFSPRESKKCKNICPVCKKPLVIGVLNRVEELSEREDGYKLSGAPGFKKMVELDKIIAEALGVKSRSSKKVQTEYDKLIKIFGTEIGVLLDAKTEELKSKTLPLIAEGVERVRSGNLFITPGFDGQYGKIEIFDKKELAKQRKLV